MFVSCQEPQSKSSPIDKDEYLLICCRYVELNPVRAGIVRWSENYRWLSYKAKCKIGGEPVDWLDLDQHYMHLGSTTEERVKRYEEWVKGSIPAIEWNTIWQAVQRGQLTGRRRFIEEVEKKIGRRIELRRQGRPRKDEK